MCIERLFVFFGGKGPPDLGSRGPVEVASIEGTSTGTSREPRGGPVEDIPRSMQLHRGPGNSSGRARSLPPNKKENIVISPAGAATYSGGLHLRSFHSGKGPCRFYGVSSKLSPLFRALLGAQGKLVDGKCRSCGRVRRAFVLRRVILI